MPDEYTPEVGTADAPAADEALGTSEQAPSGGSTDAEGGSGETVRISVPGIEGEFTPDEILEWRNGNLRQADYTKKTQEVAADKQRLVAAERIFLGLQENPVETMAFLAETLGWSPQDTQAAVDALDPVEQMQQKLTALETAQADQRAQAELQLELSTLRQQYGEFDNNELLQHAIDNNIGRLDVALRDLRTMKAVDQRSAATSAKRNAPPVAGGNSTTIAKSGVPAREGPPANVREALADALREHGLTELPSPGPAFI